VEKLARYLDKEKKIGVKLIVSAHVLKRISHVASTSISAEQVLDMPSIVIGSVEQMVEQLYQRRERYGFSYYVVTDQHMQTLAPVVAQLAGKA
jgi:RNA processing factor Prp31